MSSINEIHKKIDLEFSNEKEKRIEFEENIFEVLEDTCKKLSQ
jgi:hypothetical protein